MKFFKYILIGSLILTIYSCNNSPDLNNENLDIYASDTSLIQNIYPPIKDSTVLAVMQMLSICSLSDTNTVLEPCDFTKFRVFKLGPNKPLNKGFILEMKEGLYNAPVKQILIIEKIFNKYKIINRYFGFLIEFRTKESGYNDILIGYKDPDIGIIAIRHQWIKENYDPVSVEEINGYYIKAELKDSINKLFISNFNAGY